MFQKGFASFIIKKDRVAIADTVFFYDLNLLIDYVSLKIHPVFDPGLALQSPADRSKRELQAC
jgi:hypothetical protein